MGKTLSVYIRNQEGSFCLNMPDLNSEGVFVQCGSKGQGMRTSLGSVNWGVCFLSCFFICLFFFLPHWIAGALFGRGACLWQLSQGFHVGVEVASVSSYQLG